MLEIWSVKLLEDHNAQCKSVLVLLVAVGEVEAVLMVLGQAEKCDVVRIGGGGGIKWRLRSCEVVGCKGEGWSQEGRRLK